MDLHATGLNIVMFSFISIRNLVYVLIHVSHDLHAVSVTNFMYIDNVFRSWMYCTVVTKLCGRAIDRESPRVRFCRQARATRDSSKMQKPALLAVTPQPLYVPFGVTYEKIGTIQRRLAWPLHKDDTLSRSGRPTGLNIYFSSSLKSSSSTVHGGFGLHNLFGLTLRCRQTPIPCLFLSVLP